jgi:hypothetical protein
MLPDAATLQALAPRMDPQGLLSAGTLAIREMLCVRPSVSKRLWAVAARWRPVEARARGRTRRPSGKLSFAV